MPRYLKHKEILFGALLFTFLAALLWNPRQPALAEEMLVNGGFEDNSLNPWQAINGVISAVTSPVHGGSSAAALTSSSTAWMEQAVNVTPGGRYTLSGWALKNDSRISKAYLQISWRSERDGYGTELGRIQTEELTLDQLTYQPLTTGPVTATLGAPSAKVRAYLETTQGHDVTVYFDDLSFLREEPTPTPTATTSLTPTFSPVASTATPTPVPSLTFTPVATISATPIQTATPTLTPTPTIAPELGYRLYLPGIQRARPGVASSKDTSISLANPPLAISEVVSTLLLFLLGVPLLILWGRR